MRVLIFSAVVPLAFVLGGGCDRAGSSGQSVTASIDTELPDTPAAQQNAKSEPPLLAPQFPVVVIDTSLGEFRVQLDLEKAPITGKNYLWYASNGHYDGTIFHQVVPNYMALGGGYTPEFVEKPTQFWIRNEAYNGLKNKKGTIAMARRPDEADSSTCQFFLNLTDNPHLDHQSRDSAETYGYCVFGKVVDGNEVLDKLSEVSVEDRDAFSSVPQSAVVIRKVTVPKSP